MHALEKDDSPRNRRVPQAPVGGAEARQELPETHDGGDQNFWMIFFFFFSRVFEKNLLLPLRLTKFGSPLLLATRFALAFGQAVRRVHLYDRQEKRGRKTKKIKGSSVEEIKCNNPCLY